MSSSGPKPGSSGLLSARRDAMVLAVLITAVLLLIWNGSAFFNHLRIEGSAFAGDVRVASTALTLNVALILFGWRRYIDLQHEAEVRAEQVARIPRGIGTSNGVNETLTGSVVSPLRFWVISGVCRCLPPTP